MMSKNFGIEERGVPKIYEFEEREMVDVFNYMFVFKYNYIKKGVLEG